MPVFIAKESIDYIGSCAGIVLIGCSTDTTIKLSILVEEENRNFKRVARMRLSRENFVSNHFRLTPSCPFVYWWRENKRSSHYFIYSWNWKKTPNASESDMAVIKLENILENDIFKGLVEISSNVLLIIGKSTIYLKDMSDSEGSVL